MRRSREAVIDTNVLAYDTFGDSAHHESAAELLDELERWYVPLIVVYEYVWLLRGLGVGAEIARAKIMEYVGDERAVLVREGLEEVLWALSAIVSEGLSLSRFNDKVVLAIAARRGLPVATYDAKLRGQAARLGLEMLPEKV